MVTESTNRGAARKLIMWSLVTVDGYFEGPHSWDLDWHAIAWGKDLEQFVQKQSKTVDTLLFGRVTYEGMASYWTTAEGEIADFMNGVPKIVFSRTLERADWRNTRLVRGDPTEEVARLKRQAGGDLYIFGSAQLSATLMEHGLIDEYRLGLTPVLLGEGNPLFKGGAGREKLRLLEARPLDSGCVILRYVPDRQ